MAEVSFAAAILPLFRQIDIDHMKPHGVLLDDYAYMADPAGDHAHASGVYDSLTGKTAPRMPPGGPYWPETQLAILEAWIAGGYQP